MTMRNGYRIALAVVGVVAACDPGADPGSDDDRGHIIALGSVVIDIHAVAAPAVSTTADGRALIKFPGPVSAEQLAALAATAQIYAYLPHDSFLVRPFAGSAIAMAQTTAPSLGASWVGAYLPAYKVGRATSELAAMAPADEQTVMVSVFPDADVARIADA